METRANYVIVGVATLLTFLGSLFMIMWFAKNQSDQSFTRYDVLFSSVSGLGEAGPVRYNGLAVGSVLKLELDDDDPSLVRVTVEVDSDVVVREDTTATLELQGVTGVSYVSLEGGAIDSPKLKATDGHPYPQIMGQASAVQTLLTDAPRLIDEGIGLITDLRSIVSEENRKRIDEIIANVDNASGHIEQTLDDVSSLTSELGPAAESVSTFANTLNSMSGNIDSTLKAAENAFNEADVALEDARGLIGHTDEVMLSANHLLQNDIPDLSQRLGVAVDGIREDANSLSSSAKATLENIDIAAQAATARLNQAETLIASLEDTSGKTGEAADAVSGFAIKASGFVTDDAKPLADEARQTLASARALVENIDTELVSEAKLALSDIRGAIVSFNTTADALTVAASSASGDFNMLAVEASTTLSQVTETFRNANRTLTSIDIAMDQATATLATANTTFEGANKVINEDVAGIADDVRSSLDNISTSMAQVAQDMPVITGDIRAATSRAASIFVTVDKIIKDNDPEIRAFLENGLSQFSDFFEESRSLVESLQRLSARIESDPARFILNTNTSEFNRGANQ